MKKQYIYPSNMATKPKLWFWSLRDIIILGVALTVSVVSTVKLGFALPLAGSALYGFLSIRVEDFSVLDYIIRAGKYFLAAQQYFEWKERS